METADFILEIISTVGFPIAVAVAMGWFILKIYNRSEKREKELQEMIAKSQAVNAEAIKTLSTYTEKLDVIQSDVNEIKTIILHHE